MLRCFLLGCVILALSLGSSACRQRSAGLPVPSAAADAAEEGGSTSSPTLRLAGPATPTIPPGAAQQGETSTPDLPTRAPVPTRSSSTPPPPSPASPTNTQAAPLRSSPTPPEVNATLSPDMVTFTPLEPGHKLVISEIDMKPGRSGWAKGGSRDRGNHVLFSRYDAERWQDVTPPHAFPRALQDSLRPSASFYSREHAWIVYDAPGTGSEAPLIVWRTDDSGESWRPSNPISLQGPTSPERPPILRRAAPGSGWLAIPYESIAEGPSRFSLLHSLDGGASWAEVELPRGQLPEGCGLSDMAFSAEIGVLTLACSDDVLGPQVVWTLDGGESWETQTLRPPPNKTPEAFRGLACDVHSPRILSGSWFVLVADCTAPTGEPSPLRLLYETLDSREHWYVTRYPGGTLFAFDDGRELAAGREIFLREPQSPTWRLVDSLSWDGQFDFTNYWQGWAVARKDGQIALVWTNDSGRVWREVEPELVASR